jgi:hypothetical protein
MSIHVQVELPPMNVVVEAVCIRHNGDIETHFIRRIPSKDYGKGWQWSHRDIKTYFALEVKSWSYIVDPNEIKVNEPEIVK